MEFSFLLRQYCLLGEYTHMIVKSPALRKQKAVGFTNLQLWPMGLCLPLLHFSSKGCGEKRRGQGA